MKKFLLCIVFILNVAFIGSAQTKIYTLVADGHTDDTEALNAWGKGEKVLFEGKILDNTLENKTCVISRTVTFHLKKGIIQNNLFIESPSFKGFIRLHFGKEVQFVNNDLISEKSYKRRKPKIAKVK